jgi:glutamine amidotransferase
MAGLRERGLVQSIQEYAASGRPLLGICLGMQMLASVGEEFGAHRGLGLIPGRVVAVPGTTTDGTRHKIPNTGWRSLQPASDSDWTRTSLGNLTPGTSIYMVHSYHLVPDDPSHLLAWCDYGGHRLTAAVGFGRILGCQFHPEKSGPAGLRILSRFVSD